MKTSVARARSQGIAYFREVRYIYAIMIWLGRLISIPVGVVFFVLLLLTLVLLQVSDRFLDPDYYPAELRKANIYEFVLVDLLTSALDEARELKGEDLLEGLDENPLATSGLSTQEIVSSINRAVPPEWVQGLVEQSFDQFGRYLTGERDEFQVTVRAGDQVVTMVDETKSLLRKADAYNLLFEREVIPRIEAAAHGELPLGVEISSERLLRAVRTTVPADWVRLQVEAVLDEVTPYLVGERDTFEINIQLSDRVDVALGQIKALLRESDAYELLYSEVVEPAVLDNLGAAVELPFGVTVIEEEVMSALRRVADPQWVQRQAEMVIDDASPYITGKVDTFASEVSLVDNKRQARLVIDKLVNTRLTEIIEGLPECKSLDDLRAALSGGTQGLPLCVPPNIPVGELLGRLDINIGEEVERFVLAPVPDRITFTDRQLRAALVQAGAGENLDLLDEAREILKEGWTYTQADLKTDLARRGDDHVETLDDIRAFLAEGWTYTEADFRENLAEQGGTGAIDGVDRVRDSLKASRIYRWVVYLPMLLLIVSIGFLGGRGWSGRVSYAASFLVVSTGLIFVAFGPGYGALAPSAFDEARDQALKKIDETHNFADTAQLAVNEALDMVESVADGLASGIAISSLSLAVIGLIALGSAIFWSAIMGVVDRFLPGKDR